MVWSCSLTENVDGTMNCQQVAFRLYKVAGEARFLLWAVCSILLQVRCIFPSLKVLMTRYTCSFNYFEQGNLI